MENQTKNQPIETYKANGVELSIWQNRGQNGDYRTATIQRSFKDANGNWKSTRTLRLNDLAILAALASEAFKHHGIAARQTATPDAEDDIPF